MSLMKVDTDENVDPPVAAVTQRSSGRQSGCRCDDDERPTSASQHLRLLAASEQASTPRGFIHAT